MRASLGLTEPDPVAGLTVNGVLLATIVDTENITLLDPRRPEFLREQVDRLLGIRGPDFTDGRTALLVCPLCSDLACGATSALVEVTDDEVHWRDLATQNDHGDTWPVEPPLTITFDRGAYETVLSDFRNQGG